MRMQFEPAPPAGKLTREQTKAAFERYHLLAKGNHAGGDWDRMGEMYAENASYYDAFYGWLHGREAITRWLRESMKGLEGWEYPVQWVAIDEGRVVVHWLNRLPGARPDGSRYEFPGLSAITYNDDGKVIRQLDLYDGIDTLETVFEAKLGPVGRALRQATRVVGPALRESTRAFYRLFEKS
ncbi:MAG: nuclear transport factor 2 family protein [Myxococcales bacterium]